MTEVKKTLTKKLPSDVMWRSVFLHPMDLYGVVEKKRNEHVSSHACLFRLEAANTADYQSPTRRTTGLSKSLEHRRYTGRVKFRQSIGRMHCKAASLPCNLLPARLKRVVQPFHQEGTDFLGDARGSRDGRLSP